MNSKKLADWIELGARLDASNPEKFDQVTDALRNVVDAQETISEYDWQLMFREGRPTKQYLA